MSSNDKRVLAVGVLVAALLLGGVFAAIKLAGNSSGNSSTTSGSPTGSGFTAPPVVTTGSGSTGGIGGSTVGANQMTTVGSIAPFVPAGSSEITDGSTGSQDYLAYVRGPAHVNISSQPLITGDNIATVTELYGNYRKARAINLGGGTGYLFEHTDGGYAIFNAVSIQKNNVVVVTTTVPAKDEARGRAELIHAAHKLQVFKTHN